jgi:hypothetical protein
MIGTLSVISVVAGTACAYRAGRHPQNEKAMEAFGGLLLIAGFALLGVALQSIFAPC